MTAQTTRTTIKLSKAGDVYVGRPNRRIPADLVQRTEFGNPFPIGIETPGRRQEVIDSYRRHLLGSPELLLALPDLRGHRLVCWCPPNKPCHADVLIELLDTYTDEQIQAGEVRR